MASGYQDEVGSYINYNNVKTPFGFTVRGPLALDSGSLSNSISFIGAAQSYGVWCEYPFPLLVSNALSLQCLNLGHAGAGPLAFLNPKIIDLVNQTKLCVVQVMSGRSVSNRYMQKVAGAARVLLKHPDLKEESLLAHVAYAKLHPLLSTEDMKALIDESLQTYLLQYQQLEQLISVPKILLWISTRKPNYERKYNDINKILGSFPHLIDQSVFDKLSCMFDHQVMAVTDRFSSRPLWSQSKQRTYSLDRAWGKIDKYSKHYPHPYLHVLAAQKILEKISEMRI